MFDQLRLDGKVIVITGATQGLGAAFARAPFLLTQAAARIIRVNGLNIGWTLTDGEHVVQGGGDWLAEADASRPFGRLLRPDDIAPMVTHLLSDATKMITGSIIDWNQTIHGIRH